MFAGLVLRGRSLAVFVLAAGLACAASAQTVEVLSAGAFKQVALAFVPEFETRAGSKVTIDNDTAGALAKRIQGGEASWPKPARSMPPACAPWHGLPSAWR